jgi:hypothetical protein
MNRAERRAQHRQAKAYDKRTHFTKAEVEAMNSTAYELGVKHTLEAAENKLGIGKKRQERILEGLELLQILDFEYLLMKKEGKI